MRSHAFPSIPMTSGNEWTEGNEIQSFPPFPSLRGTIETGTIEMGGAHLSDLPIFWAPQHQRWERLKLAGASSPG